MNRKLTDLIEEVSSQKEVISQERIEELDAIASIIVDHLNKADLLNIIVVCTHNSRRSQLGEAWINTLSSYFGIDNIVAYSGGMEETAFNSRMVNAMKECGFGIEEKVTGNNPKYILKGIEMNDHLMFSKVYGDSTNPQNGYLALMVCDHADENCPVVIGMKYRIPLRYKDPKACDDTEKEEEAYVDKVKEIGSEMYYLLNKVILLS